MREGQEVNPHAGLMKKLLKFSSRNYSSSRLKAQRQRFGVRQASILRPFPRSRPLSAFSNKLPFPGALSSNICKTDSGRCWGQPCFQGLQLWQQMKARVARWRKARHISKREREGGREREGQRGKGRTLKNEL